MFTIRFRQHGAESHTGYKSYACRSYYVFHAADGEATVRMTFADGENYDEQVGDDTPYECAYVTNSESRTIDVVRQLRSIGAH